MRVRTALHLLFLTAFGSGASAATAPAPYDLSVDLTFADRSGDEGAREEFELQLMSELQRSSCFRSIELREEPARAETSELQLRLTVHEFFQETTYLTNLAARTDPNASRGTELAYYAHFRAVLTATLGFESDAEPLRKKTLQGSATHRPTYSGEDARQVAQREATAAAVRAIRAFLCKGGAKRLARQIERSRHN